MDAKTCLETRRSIRAFADRPVPRETVEKIIALAAFAPSWKNTQISRYIAIESQEVRNTIADKYCMSLAHNANIVRSCPVLIAQCFVKERCGYERDGSYSTDRLGGWQYFDCGIAAQTLCLAAHQEGLGTVIMGVFGRKALQSYLQVPPEQELMSLIALGYPAESPAAPKRKDVETLLTFR